MTEHSPSDKLGSELVRAVTGREPPAESLGAWVDVIAHLLTTAEGLGIRDDTMDAQARASLIAGMKRLGPSRRRLPWRSKRSEAAQHSPPALAPVTPDPG